jgi:CBS domain-containing protein
MKVADVMTHQVITVAPDASIFHAIRLMLQNKISGLPVVDAKGQLVGIVTEGDFIRRVENDTERRRSSWLQFLMSSGDLADDYVRSHGRKVEDVMSRKLQTASEQATLEEIVRTMERAKVKRVPILRGGKLVGIITRANLTRALASAARTIPPLTADDSDIRAMVLSELGKNLSKGTAGVSILVREGSVELFGTNWMKGCANH